MRIHEDARELEEFNQFKSTFKHFKFQENLNFKVRNNGSFEEFYWNLCIEKREFLI